MEKRNMYLHHQVENKSRGQTESFLIEMKERMNTLKTLAPDTYSEEILDFSKEESQRKATGDEAFLIIMGALIEQSYSIVMPPVILSSLNLAISFYEEL